MRANVCNQHKSFMIRLTAETMEEEAAALVQLVSGAKMEAPSVETFVYNDGEFLT